MNTKRVKKDQSVKSDSLVSVVNTPSGVRRMDELKVGDEVFDGDSILYVTAITVLKGFSSISTSSEKPNKAGGRHGNS